MVLSLTRRIEAVEPSHLTIARPRLELVLSQIDLPLLSERDHGAPIDIYQLPDILFEYTVPDLPFSDLKSAESLELDDLEITQIQRLLLQEQSKFNHYAVPGVHFFNNLHGIDPNKYDSMSDGEFWIEWQNNQFTTKEHERQFSWLSFIPYPFVEMINNNYWPDDIDSNLKLAHWFTTGGTSVKFDWQLVYIPIVKSDWEASLQTMEAQLFPYQDDFINLKDATQTYLDRHIAANIFRETLTRFGITTHTKNPEHSDEQYALDLMQYQPEIAIGPGKVHPNKGKGVRVAIDNLEEQIKFAMMSSVRPDDELIKRFYNNKIKVWNIGGDTRSLPIYGAVHDPNYYNNAEEFLNEMNKLRIIDFSPAYMEVVSNDGLPVLSGQSGIGAFTNYMGVWTSLDGPSRIVPSLKIAQRSTATNNLFYKIDTSHVHSEILRSESIPVSHLTYETMMNQPLKTIGGPARGGCG